MNMIETENYIRISKQKARKIYEQGGTVYALPHKLNPENLYYPPFEWKKTIKCPYSFDELNSSCVWYNCNYDELGHYLSYYLKKGE